MNTVSNKQLGVLGSVGVILLLVGGGLLAVSSSIPKTDFWSSYLYGYMFWLNLALGCLGLKLLHHTVRGQWGLSILRLLEAGGSWIMFVLLALGFLPIAFGPGMDALYHWLHPNGDKLLEARFMLTKDSWTIRTIIYFVLWIGLAAYVDSSSRREDKTGNTNEKIKREKVAAPGIIIYVISATLAVTDWVMSIDTHWFSTIYGVWFIIGQVLAALSFTTMLVCMNGDKPPYTLVMFRGLCIDLGNLLLAFTLFWAYISLSQFLIIWSGNLPEFTSYYYSRSVNGWGLIGAVNIVLGFFLPFILLLQPILKRNPKYLMIIAGLIMLSRILDVYWIIIPSLRGSPSPIISDVAAWLAFGGLWLAVFGLTAKGSELLPAHDRRLEEAKQEAMAHGT